MGFIFSLTLGILHAGRVRLLEDSTADGARSPANAPPKWLPPQERRGRGGAAILPAAPKAHVQGKEKVARKDQQVPRRPSATAPTAAPPKGPSPAVPHTAPAPSVGSPSTAAPSARSSTGKWAGTSSIAWRWRTGAWRVETMTMDHRAAAAAAAAVDLKKNPGRKNSGRLR